MVVTDNNTVRASAHPPQSVRFSIKMHRSAMVNYIRVSKKNNAPLISNKVLLKPRHHWTPQLIKSMKSLFSVCRVN